MAAFKKQEMSGCPQLTTNHYRTPNHLLHLTSQVNISLGSRGEFIDCDSNVNNK